MIRLTKVTHIIILIFALYSCQYDLTKENFVELQPPSDTHVFNLNLIPTGETIKIFQKTELTYNINTNGLGILKATFNLQNKTWDVYSNEGSLSIDPTGFKVGSDTLKLAVYLNSGTGSIADKIGAEGYYIEKKWIVLMDVRLAPKLIPTYHINADKFLMIEWPKCEQLNFISYEVDVTSGRRFIQKTITDIDRTFFIDSLYVGGDYSVRISCKVENSFTGGELLTIKDVPTQIIFKEIGFDSLRISWNKSPYKAKYRLNWNNNNLLYFNSSVDTICTIAQIGFGNWTKFELSTRSQIQEGWTDISYASDVSSFKEYYLGTRLVGANWPEFGYNTVEKTLYSNLYDYMQSFDINTYSLSNSVKIDNLIYQGLYSCPTNSAKVATITMNSIYIFNDKKLKDPIIINAKNGVDHFLLTNNDLIAYAASKVYKLIDIYTKQTIASIDIPDYPIYSKWACMTTSQDAKFMCVATLNGIKIYKIENGQVVESYSDQRRYRSAYFNPNHPDQLYLTLDDQLIIEVRNPSDFNLLNRIDIPSKMVIQNIDPETNNILLTNYERLFVINIETHKVLLNLPCDESKIWLYNNNLFTNTGYALEISENL